MCEVLIQYFCLMNDAPIQSGNNATINIVVIIWNTGTSITLCNKTNNVTGIMIGAKIDVNKVNKTVKIDLL